MANTTLPGVLLTGNHAGRPTATDVATGTLYACSTHSLLYQSDGATWSTWATLGGGAPAAHAASHEDGGSDEIDVTGLVGAGGGGGAVDPIAELFGAADTAFEFDSSSLTGLTALGTATAEDADTTVPGHYFLRKAATGSEAWTGRYASAPSAPFTAIAKIDGCNLAAVTTMKVGAIFIGEATPGNMDLVAVGYPNPWSMMAWRYSNPTTWAGDIGTHVASAAVSLPVYLAIKVSSSTSTDGYISFGGWSWHRRYSARNPSITIASVGIATEPSQATHDAHMAVDFLRIWNSAKTFPGY